MSQRGKGNMIKPSITVRQMAAYLSEMAQRLEEQESALEVESTATEDPGELEARRIVSELAPGAPRARVPATVDADGVKQPTCICIFNDANRSPLHAPHCPLHGDPRDS